MATRNLIRLTLLIALGLGSAACAGKKQAEVPDEPIQTETAVEVEEEEAAQAPEVKKIVLYNYRFNPNQLNITVGTQVTFENKDPDRHNVNIPALAIDENLDSGAAFTYTFDTAGSFAVSNRFASSPMKMTIEVAE